MLNFKGVAQAFSKQTARVVDVLNLTVGFYLLRLNKFETFRSKSCWISVIVDVMKNMIAPANYTRVTIYKNTFIANLLAAISHH